MGHRVPSPRELQVHTQTLFQNALLKKKLEEQRENYRRRHEQQQQRSGTPVNSPAGNKQTHSPTPLAFTPTSVLRKMTADKEPEGAMLTCAQIEHAQRRSRAMPLVAKMQPSKLLQSPDSCTPGGKEPKALKSKPVLVEKSSPGIVDKIQVAKSISSSEKISLEAGKDCVKVSEIEQSISSTEIIVSDKTYADVAKDSPKVKIETDVSTSETLVNENNSTSGKVPIVEPVLMIKAAAKLEMIKYLPLSDNNSNNNEISTKVNDANNNNDQKIVDNDSKVSSKNDNDNEQFSQTASENKLNIQQENVVDAE